MDHPSIRATGEVNRPERLRQQGADGTATRQPNVASGAGRATKSDAPAAASADAVGEAWLAELPIAVLRDPQAVLAEWAWRRELAVIPGNSDSAQLPPDYAITAAEQAGQGVAQLWSVLSDLAGGSTARLWQVDVPHTSIPDMAGQGLLPFASLTQLPATWPDTLKRLVLRDRITASVREEGRAHIGEGLFAPGGPTATSASVAEGMSLPAPPRPAADSTRLVRWRAERHSLAMADGRTLHHLRLQLQVDGAPVEVALLSCHPSLSVHVATNHRQLRERCKAADSLRAVVRSLGWQLDRWTVSDLDGQGEG